MASVSDSEPLDPARALSPRQERIAQLLQTQVGRGAADFFRDACVLISEQPPHLAVTHLVAHLYREIESALRSVLEPDNAAAGVRGDRHGAKVRAVLDDLGIAHDDVAAVIWLGLAGGDNGRGLAARAHRAALDPPRLLDDDFLAFCDEVEQMLDSVLERFETFYFGVFERLDTLLATPRPSASDARKLRQNSPNTLATMRYFFSQASSSWVAPLHEAGLFSTPPAAEPDEGGTTVQFPLWPQSQYLVRVAADAPDAVLEAALGIPATDNSPVNHDLVEVAAALPPELGAQLVAKIVEALGNRFGILFPQAAGTLIVQLCSGGQVDAAVDLANALLRRLPSGNGRRSHVSSYEYSAVLHEHIPALVAVAGMTTLTMLAKLLDELMTVEAEERRGAPGQDGSALWRPSIQGAEGQAESDVRDALINAVRDTALQVIASGQGQAAEVVAELESHDWLIFRRLSLYVLAHDTNQACDLVQARLTDAVLAREHGLGREYLALAQAGAQCLDATSTSRLLALIEAGPELRTRRAAQPAPGSAEDEPEALVRERIAVWQRDRLAAVKDVLPPRWQARHQELVAEYGEAADPTAPAPATFWVWSGEEPVSAAQLAAMPTVDLVEFLRTWKPPTDSWRVAPGSLRSALTGAIQADAVGRSSEAAWFIGLPAEYVGAVISGLWQATINGAALDWAQVITLCTWIDEQAHDELNGASSELTYRQWREARIDMLRLLMAGLNLEPNPISSSNDAQLWSVIERSCGDPDPAQEREAARSQDADGGFMSLALDAVRPQAVRAAITYGLRLRRRDPNPDLSRVEALLEQHLDPWQDPSCAVRSIYGELFASLVWMDGAWAARQVDALFPADPNQRMLFAAAWEAYLAGGRLTDEAWALLRDTYGRFVDRMDRAAPERSEESAAGMLGNHLMNRLWFGQLAVDRADRLLPRFYEKASPEVTTRMLWSVGHGLADPNSAEPDRLARLRSLWDFRVAAVKAGADSRELAEFGRWFASGQFDDEWALQQLLVTLNLARRLEAPGPALARVAELSKDHTQTCLGILLRWIEQRPHSWLITQSLDGIRRVLTDGLADGPAAVDTAQKIISILGRDEHIDLRDLLRSVSARPADTTGE